MIGYYVHHVGRGHLHRATVLAHELGSHGLAVTGLSSLPRPADWTGEWILLPRDDLGGATDPTARARLHWAPRGDVGLCSRTARVAAWIDRERPDAVVVDVSVEITLLVRLHGVPVVGVVLPGRRGDAAHRLGFDVADRLVAFWPARARGMLGDVPAEVLSRVEPLGALSRFRIGAASRRTSRRALLLLGQGGHDVGDARIAMLRTATPQWSWTLLDGRPGRWAADPSTAVAAADVVVTHAGQNAIAEVAAARRPAVVLPQARPHAEQRTTATALNAGGWPVTVCEQWPDAGWPDRLSRTAALDGGRWSSWCDGRAAQRFADVVRSVGGARG